ncbi:DUF523 domain-containing protein [Yinghuangia aomiensis]
MVAIDGGDVTAAFLSGAERCLDLAARHGIRIAVLKAKSPSCGNDHAYDGTFTGTLLPGEGSPQQPCAERASRVFHEDQLDEAERALQGLESK